MDSFDHFDSFSFFLSKGFLCKVISPQRNGMEERKRKREEDKAEESTEAKLPKRTNLSMADLWEEAKRKRAILKSLIADREEYNKLRNVIAYNTSYKYWSAVSLAGYRLGNHYMMECSLEAVTEVFEELNA